MNCTFCKIYQKGEDVIYENKLFFAIFDHFPVSPGHAEVIPKRHAISLSDLVEEEQSKLLPAIFNVQRKIEQTDFRKFYEYFIDNPLNDKSVEYCQKMLIHIGVGKKPDGYNIGINDGEAAGRTIDHLHVHIIPRYFGDVEDPVGGVRHIIPGKGNYRK